MLVIIVYYHNKLVTKNWGLFFNLIGSNQANKAPSYRSTVYFITPLFCGLIDIYGHKTQYYGFKIQKT